MKENINLSTYEKQTLINARVGQGEFRKKLMELWNNECSVSGCKTGAVLRASHIKPWSRCSDKEKLDSNNGLILSANIDALFDGGLISFTNEGMIIVSKKLSNKEKDYFKLNNMKLSKSLNDKQKEYLQFHKNNIFIP